MAAAATPAGGRAVDTSAVDTSAVVLPGCAGAGPGADSLAWPTAALDAPVALRAMPAPRFPPELAASGQDGVVVLRYVVGPAGRAEGCTIQVVSTTHPAFVAPAREAVMAGRFSAPTRRGAPARALITQTVRFKLGPTIQIGP